MVMPAKSLRNTEIVRLRDQDPVKYSWRQLGDMFSISHMTVKEIYERTKPKMDSEKDIKTRV